LDTHSLPITSIQISTYAATSTMIVTTVHFVHLPLFLSYFTL